MAWPINDSDAAPTLCNRFEDSFVPFERMPDSESYLDRLENRLARLKSGPLNSKMVLQGLRSLRESCHLEDSSGDGAYVTEEAVDVFAIERKLFPSKCLTTTEEGQRLLDSDVLAQSTQENEREKDDPNEIPR